MRSSRKTDLSSQKSLTARAWDGILVFILKTIVPLVPLVAVFVIAGYFMNMEVAGTYEGSTPQTGALRLVLNEDNDVLTGLLVLKADDRYKIAEGKMLGDTKMQIVCRKDVASSISAISSKSKIVYNDANDETKIPDNISKTPSLIQDEAAAGPEIKIDAEKDQNSLRGKMDLGDGQTIKFEVQRNTFSSFFGWRWLTRILKSIGIKI